VKGRFRGIGWLGLNFSLPCLPVYPPLEGLWWVKGRFRGIGGSKRWVSPPFFKGGGTPELAEGVGWV